MESHPPYAALACTSNFSFLTGASHPQELVAQAAELGYDAVAFRKNVFAFRKIV